ncbi:hypothetical protein HDU85_005976 [Gaertneriomyces sp. JEL0708]|nr:hypothetical protein HDU85_005976 [Gaertneriomyces sp. JEL0708]
MFEHLPFFGSTGGSSSTLNDESDTDMNDGGWNGPKSLLFPEKDKFGSSTPSAKEVKRSAISQIYLACKPQLDIPCPHLVRRDGNSVIYIGKGTNRSDVGVVRTNVPLSPRAYIGYWEVEIVSSGDTGSFGITVGLSRKDTHLNRHPGQDANSWSWYLISDKKMHDGSEQQYDEIDLETGDVVGCGYCFEKGEIFFTHNGRLIGNAFSGVKGNLYPTVGLHVPEEGVRLNFGEDEFAYDIDAYVEERKSHNRGAILSKKVNAADVLEIVKDYLLCEGFRETWEELQIGEGIDASSPFATDHSGDLARTSLAVRSEIRTHILHGDICTAARLTEESFPTAMSNRLRLHLICQEFVELLRLKATVDAIVECVRGRLGPLTASAQYNEEDAQLVKDVISLLAYTLPDDAPAAYLMDESRRYTLADDVNSSSFESDNCGSVSALEQGLKHLLLLRSHSRVFQDAVTPPTPSMNSLRRSSGSTASLQPQNSAGDDRFRSREILTLADVASELWDVVA